jgi:5'-AMP-activated protein kinase, catalytic alpha subunit
MSGSGGASRPSTAGKAREGPSTGSAGQRHDRRGRDGDSYDENDSHAAADDYERPRRGDRRPDDGAALTPLPSASANATKGSGPSGSSKDNKETIVGAYSIGKILGKGTFGLVREGIHLPTGQPVAVKVLDKSRIKEVADAQRVAREIKVLKRLRHPNIVQLFEQIEAPKAILLVMELVDSGELFQYIVKNTRLNEPQAVAFLHDIVDGLSFLHSKEVAHRDLKPGE